LSRDGELANDPANVEHVITYLRLLDASEEGPDSRVVSRIVLHIDARAGA